jgi:ribonuclease HII
MNTTNTKNVKKVKNTTNTKKKVIKTPLKYKYFETKHKIEAGIDEVGRGCLAGPVVSAAVILPEKFPNDIYKQIKDSKKLTEKKREMLYDYITKYACDYAIASISPEEIDKINILQATFNAMHNAVDKLAFVPDILLVDGDKFKPYKSNNDRGELYIEHRCVKGGDNVYYAIAAASILAKVSRDRYIKTLCQKHPELDQRYGWVKNKAYGTKQHRDGIKEHGITEYHRKTFGICREFTEENQQP